MEKLYNLWGAWAPWPPVPMPMLPGIPGLVGFYYCILGKFGGGKLGIAFLRASGDKKFGELIDQSKVWGLRLIPPGMTTYWK